MTFQQLKEKYLKRKAHTFHETYGGPNQQEDTREVLALIAAADFTIKVASAPCERLPRIPACSHLDPLKCRTCQAREALAALEAL